MKSKAMRMVALLVSFSILNSNIPIQSATTPIAGQRCAKKGNIVIIGNKKFTCIKSGNKLIWDKGVSIKKPAPSSNPSPTPTATPTSTPTPSPAPTSDSSQSSSFNSSAFTLTSQSQLSDVSICKLSEPFPPMANSIGFERPKIVHDSQNANILLIPVHFDDQNVIRLNTAAMDKLTKSVRDFYFQQSDGKVNLKFSFTPIDPLTKAPEGLDFSDSRKYLLDYSRKPKDLFDLYLNNSKKEWNLDKYDSVAFVFNIATSSLSFAWSYSDGARKSDPNTDKLISKNGPLESAVITYADLPTLAHELGHSLFRYLDLYSQISDEKFTLSYDLMGNGMQSDRNLFIWQKWIWNWLSDSQIRCVQASGITKHYISTLTSNSAEVKGVIFQRTRSSGVVIENRGQGIIVYSIDLWQGNGNGPIRVSKKTAVPISTGSTLNDFGLNIKVEFCDSKGCYVTVENTIPGNSDVEKSYNSGDQMGIPVMEALADSANSGHVLFNAIKQKSYEVIVYNEGKGSIYWRSGIINSANPEIRTNFVGLKCASKYPVSVTVWSEENGKGESAQAANDNQLVTPFCSS